MLDTLLIFERFCGESFGYYGRVVGEGRSCTFSNALTDSSLLLLLLYLDIGKL